MARTFRRRREAHPIAELNITNLVDLAFVLLIVFMIATPLIHQEQKIPINLPVESESPQQKVDPKDRHESITIFADGRIALGDRPMTLVTLIPELERFAAETNPPVIHLRMDAKAMGQHIVSVMDELKKRNLKRIAIDTQVAR
jgi:biopolymer transport protein TolR